MKVAPYYQTKFIETIPFAINSELQLRNGIPQDFPLRGLLLDFRGRITVTDPGAGAAGALLPEAPFSLINRIIVEGVHRQRGTETIFNMEASTLRRYNQFYIGQLPSYYNPDTLAGAIGAYDLAFQLYVPFTLERVSPDQELMTLLDAQSYDSLTLRIQSGSDDNVFNAAHTMTDAFTAFENAAGVPTVNVSRIVGLLGKDVNFRPALVKRTFRDIDTAVLTGNDLHIADLQVGNTVRSYFLKYFNRDVAPQAPAAAAFYTRSNTPLVRTRIKLNEVPIRDINFAELQSYNLFQYGIPEANHQFGYGCFEFVENGDMDQGLVTFDFATRNKRLALTGDIVGVANDRLHIITTEIIPAAG